MRDERHFESLIFSREMMRMFYVEARAIHFSIGERHRLTVPEKPNAQNLLARPLPFPMAELESIIVTT